MRYLRVRSIEIFGFLLFSFLFLFLAAGCRSFDREWEEAAKQPVIAGDIEGPWQGTWKSDATGHTDKLRCMITKQSEGNYNARFKAKYHTVMSFSMAVPLKVLETNGTYHFTGDADLGWLAGGKYQYVGNATTTNYFSTYTSKYDHGSFQMGRP
jgi:hypothetical protein